MEAVLFVVAGVMAMGLFDVLVWARGADSTDGLNSREWQKRRDWTA